MAEALAVIGLVSAIVQFVEFGSKIISRVSEFQTGVNDVPKSFRDIMVELPLLLDTLKRTKEQVEDGQVDENTQKALLPVVNGCQSQVELLNDILVKMLPSVGDSSWKRGIKAFSSVRQERKVEQITKTFHNYIQTLTYYEVTGHIKSKAKLMKPFFMVPFERDPKYITRADIASQISQRLGTHNRVALAGLGGVGKSQIAVEYCYEFKDENPAAHVFWIHTSTVARFDQAYKEIARKLSLPGWDRPETDTLQLVSEWLSDEDNGRWLLVLDNADDAETFFGSKIDSSPQANNQIKCLANYLPQSSNGSIMITTRDGRVGERLANRERPIMVPRLTPVEAELMLRSKFSDIRPNEAYSRELLDALEYLPLAIAQASAFVSENRINISDYLKLFHDDDSSFKRLLSEDLEDSRRDFDTPNSVIRTLKLSFEQIMKQQPRAAEMLSLMAVLDRQRIPKILLCRYVENAIDLTVALGTLQAFSLITPEEGGMNFEMHRLVQLSIQNWLELEGTITKWQGGALALISEIFPSGYYENWVVCEALLPHVQVVVGYDLGTESCLLQRARILENAARYDVELGKHEDALKKSIEATEIFLKVLGPEHSDTISSMGDLAWIYYRQGQFKEAEERIAQVIELDEKTLETEDLDKLNILEILALVYVEQGRWQEAEKLQEHVLDKRKKVLVPEHSLVQSSISNLAMTYYYQRRFKEAEELWVQVLELRKRVQGPEHPDTLVTMSSLASTWREQGCLKEAEELQVQVLELIKRVLGPEHPATLLAMVILASIWWEQNHLKEAEELDVQVLELSKRVLGPEHPDTLLVMANLAQTWKKQGQRETALSLLSEALELSQRVIGIDHLDTKYYQELYDQWLDESTQDDESRSVSEEDMTLGTVATRK